MLAAAGYDHTRLADLAPPFVVRHVYSTEWVSATSNEKCIFPPTIIIAYDRKLTKRESTYKLLKKRKEREIEHFEKEDRVIDKKERERNRKCSTRESRYWQKEKRQRQNIEY